MDLSPELTPSHENHLHNHRHHHDFHCCLFDSLPLNHRHTRFLRKKHQPIKHRLVFFCYVNTMKILFVRPAFPATAFVNRIAVCEPLELELLAASVKSSHDVELLDMRVDERSLTEIISLAQPQVVAFSGYTMDVPAINQLAATVKKLSSEIIVVVGGEHASHLPDDFGEAIDHVFQNNALLTFPDFIDSISSQIKPQRIIREKVGAKDVFDVTPFRKLSSRYMKRYRFGAASPISLAQLSSGCKYRCSYCSIPARQPNFQRRSIDDSIAHLADCPTKHVLCIDSNALQDLPIAIELFTEIARSKLGKKVMISCRSDTIASNPYLPDLLKQADVSVVAFGLESFDNAALKKFRKGNSALNNQSAVRLCQEAGLLVRGNFIIDQSYTADDFQRFKDAVIESKIEFPSLSILTPLPGTAFFEESRPRWTTNDYRLFDLSHSVLPTHLPPEEFHLHFRNLFSHFYGVNRLFWLASRIPLSLAFNSLGAVAASFRRFQYNQFPV